MSESYQIFLRFYINTESWAERKDGVPLELLDALTPDDKSQAEDELISRLSSWRDSWPIVGLGHLGSKKALPRLYALLPKAFGAIKAEIALAIWKISHDEEMLEVVLKCSRRSTISLLTGSGTFKLIDVEYCLAQFPQAKAKERLSELTNDSDYLVSYNANRALELRKTLYGIET